MYKQKPKKKLRVCSKEICKSGFSFIVEYDACILIGALLRKIFNWINLKLVLIDMCCIITTYN